MLRSSCDRPTTGSFHGGCAMRWWRFCGSNRTASRNGFFHMMELLLLLRAGSLFAACMHLLFGSQRAPLSALSLSLLRCSRLAANALACFSCSAMHINACVSVRTLQTRSSASLQELAGRAVPLLHSACRTTRLVYMSEYGQLVLQHCCMPCCARDTGLSTVLHSR